MPCLSSIWKLGALGLGIEEVPIDGATGIRAEVLNEFNSDPADRMIVATAQTRNARLVTSDREILGWPGALDRHDARR